MEHVINQRPPVDFYCIRYSHSYSNFNFSNFFLINILYTGDRTTSMVNTANDPLFNVELFTGIIEITGGAAATNATLIQWIQSNAEQIVDSAPPPSFSDVEVTPHDGYITMTINGVDFNLKTAASVSLISFSIDDGTFQAEEGMTWAEWVDSAYNTDAFSSDGRNIRSNLSASYGRVVGVVVCGAVSPSDTITEDYNYVLYGEGSCD